jgi:hypothetical protein
VARAFSHETLTTTVLFDREIVRILNSHCVMCHMQNGPAFPLETYEQAWLQKRQIRAAVIARRMPPWAAVPGYGQFANDNSLTLRETQFIISWVEGLGPRNSGTVFTNIAGPDAARPQEVSAHAHLGHWELGEPQLVRKFSSEATRTIIDLGLNTDRLVRAIEYLPADRRLLRGASFIVQETGQWIGSWTPWFGSMSLPKGTAWRLPAHSHIVAEIHYAGAKQHEEGTLGLFFSGEATPISDLVLETKTDSATPQRSRAAVRLPASASIVAVVPEVRPELESLEVTARKPDGGTEILLFAKDFPLDWPAPYILKSPVALPAGTEISAVAYSQKPGVVRVTLSTSFKRKI